MILALAGDWHGNTRWAQDRLESIGERRGVDTVLHVGGFGIWPGPSGRRYLAKVEETCARYDLTALMTPGNHEVWNRLMGLWEHPSNRRDDGALLPLYLTEHVTVVPRGYRWEMGGRWFVSLGGAPSVDVASRTQGADWWPEEAITQADVDLVVAGGHADVMLTHDSPDLPGQVEPVAAIIATNDMGLPDRALWYAAEGRARLTEAFLAVQPWLLVHGHYHVTGEARVGVPGGPGSPGRTCRIVALAADGATGNVRLLDLETLEDPS